MAQGQLRIVAGQWRSRRLTFSAQPGLRPTPDRVRETLFNWLQGDVAGSRVLDAFAGSGALGFEAASRGAAEVVMLEQQSAVADDLQRNIDSLQAQQVQLQRGDTLRWLHDASVQPFDLVLLDPPFRSDLLAQSVVLLARRHWLANHAKIYVEAGSDTDWQSVLPAGWRQLKIRTAGQVAYSLWQWSE